MGTHAGMLRDIEEDAAYTRRERGRAALHCSVCWGDEGDAGRKSLGIEKSIGIASVRFLTELPLTQCTSTGEGHRYGFC